MLWGKAVFFSAILTVVGAADTLPESGPCACETAKQNGGWCPACKIGYVAGVAVPSGVLYETLDAHGHEIDLSALRCESCKKAAEDGGYCENCRIGIHHKKVYFTRLTYELARGVARKRESLECEECRRSTEQTRWCGRCRQGMIGNIVLSSKEGFEAAKAEFERLLAAIRMLPQCESCAVAFFMRSLCPICRKAFDAESRDEKRAP